MEIINNISIKITSKLLSTNLNKKWFYFLRQMADLQVRLYQKNLKNQKEFKSINWHLAKAFLSAVCQIKDNWINVKILKVVSFLLTILHIEWIYLSFEFFTFILISSLAIFLLFAFFFALISIWTSSSEESYFRALFFPVRSLSLCDFSAARCLW